MKSQTKNEALFLPFMQIPTGHHHVADALIDILANNTKQFQCEKVDILSYSYGKMETLVSGAYLHWIKTLPSAYHWIYDRLAYQKSDKRKRQYLYEVLFLYFFKRLMNDHEPSILFCTHALPSNIASVLKQKNQLDSVIVNVYTDYFVNRVWGIEGVDFHFVPSIEVKNFLLQLGVEAERIYITGIPVHPSFKSSEKMMKFPSERKIRVLVSGGSLGVGGVEKLLRGVSNKYPIQYEVLCGKNELLYRKILAMNKDYVRPLPYVERKEEINTIYNEADAVVTKPGGVTVSECLWKRKPIFLCEALPGQEKINEQQLKKMGVVIPLNSSPIEKQIMSFFSDDERKEQYAKNVAYYHEQLINEQMADIVREICSSL